MTAGSRGTSCSRESEEKVHISAALASLERGPAVSSCVQEASRSTPACKLWMQVRREARPDCWTMWGRGGGSGQALGVREPPRTPKLVATAKAGGSPLGTTLELQDPPPHRQRWETKEGKKEQSEVTPRGGRIKPQLENEESRHLQSCSRF